MHDIDLALDTLQRGEVIDCLTDAGMVWAAGAFHPGGVSALQGKEADWLPVLLLASVEPLEAIASDLSADARIVIRRLLPGALAIAVHPSPLIPPNLLLPNGLLGVSVTSLTETVRLIEALGQPLVTLSPHKNPVHATLLNVTERPARFLREGVPARESLEKYLLLE